MKMTKPLRMLWTAVLCAASGVVGVQEASTQGRVSVNDLLARLEVLENEVQLLSDSNADLQIEVSSLNSTVAALDELLVHFSRTNNDVFIDGANLHVRNGLDATNTKNALGNVIVGYNELRLNGNDRSGSHMLVVGRHHNFTQFGGIVVGDNNSASGRFSAVSGGRLNTSTGIGSSVSGGIGNEASGNFSSITAGQNNDASGDLSSVTGGEQNEASGTGSSVSGGVGNDASGRLSSISGGVGNSADTQVRHPNTHN